MMLKFSKKITPEVGDIIKIPFMSEIAIGKIIWISQIYEDTFGFVVSPQLFINERTTYFEQGCHLSINIYSGSIKVLYGDIQNVVNGRWEVVGNQKLSEIESNLMDHNIAGHLWRGDKHIRKLNEEEYHQYPKFLRAGDKAIEKMLAVGFCLNA